jgi:hypothetical protein
MDVTVSVQQYVVWLYISMDDALGMYVSQSTSKFCYPKSHSVLCECFPGDVKSKIAACHQIHNQIQVFYILEAVSQIAEKRMIELFEHTAFSYYVAHTFRSYHCVTASA